MEGPIIEAQQAGRPAFASASRPRALLAHDWLCGMRGGEAVLERLANVLQERFEIVGLYVMFDDKRLLSPPLDALRARRLVCVSRLGCVPGAGRVRRWLLPFYPWAVTDLSLRLARQHARAPLSLVVSSSSAAIKGLRAPAGVPHLCYCHTPARYLWSQADEYARGGVRGWARAAGLRVFGPALRRWDRRTATAVTCFLANSRHTAGEIQRCYGVRAIVVHPPVRTDFFTPDPATPREDFWLAVSALEPYKRVDLAVEAAAKAGVRLVVAGDGSEARRLRRHAGPHVRFLGQVDASTLRSLYRRARALIFPQIEDFGIVAAEALACGLPVIARAAGGALDIVDDGQTGVLFERPDADAIITAARRLPAQCVQRCRQSALRFAPERFDQAIRTVLAQLVPTIGCGFKPQAPERAAPDTEHIPTPGA